jgi:hypothetical protein
MKPDLTGNDPKLVGNGIVKSWGTVPKAAKHTSVPYCAELLINGLQISHPGNQCWCSLLRSEPKDEITFNLGKAVLDALMKCPLKGQDGSLLVVVELRL